MRGFVACTCLLLLPLTTFADEDKLGFYADLAGTIDEIVITGEASVWIYLLAHVPSYPEGVRVLEFSVDNWPSEPGDAYDIVAVEWTTPLVIGELGESFTAVAFPFDWGVPGDDGLVLLASIQVYAVGGNWMQEDREIRITASRCANCDYEDPIVVPYGVYDSYVYIEGDVFTLNPSGADATAVAQTSFSRLKALF